ncbi:phage tail tape measure protein [Pseudomonas quasicaspiana]|uniref:phage tail tape measure protein n=1 Tax=Pseudomonas quasicaspiana TaxID=2829821 RepID=UPI001E2B7E86|nr:phage tail tape measure protein [Pseudomonas quasicaspiana]MCD5970777.1 phage tail tape measure protein [Pseudomonas quasicaspiana]
MTTIAELGIRVDSTDAAQASSDLDKLTAAGGRAEKASEGVAKGADKASAAIHKQRDELSDLLGEIDPTVKALGRLDELETKLAKHKGVGLDAATFSEYQAKIDQTRANLGRFDDGLTRTGNTAKQTAAALRGVPAQFTDIAVSLQGGQAPLTVFLQQGGQLKDMFGGAVPAAKALGGYVLGLVNPFTVAAAAIGVLTLAYYQGSEEQDKFRDALVTTGNSAGTTTSSLSGMAKQVSATVGTTGAAAAVLAQLAGTGKIVSSSFEEIAVAALAFEKATGKAASETVAEFAKLADDPVKAVVALNDKYNFLTAAVFTQIRALQEQGDTLGAQQVAERAYADALVERAGTITNNLGAVESAWAAVKSGAKGAWDAILDIGREDTFDEKFDKLADRLATLRNAQSNPLILGDNPDLGMLGRGESGAQSDVTALLQKEVDDQAKARQQMFDALNIREGTKAYETLQKNLDSTASKSTQLTKALKDNQREIAQARKAGFQITAEQEAALEKQTRDKFKETKKGGSTAVDLTGFNDAQNQLKSVLSYYQNIEKELDSAQKAGLVSAESYSSQRVALVEQERVEVAAAYESEIAALEAARGKASTSAAQRIQLDQKIADARASMVKAQQDADTELEVLANAETGRLAKQQLAISNYTDALNRQNEALQLAGQRAAEGVGLGDRQASLSGSLNGIADRANQQRLDLARDKADASRNMSAEEYQAKLDAINRSEKDLAETTLSNYEQMSAAQSDWRNGATSAFGNYLESARDVAGQTRSLFSNAFTGMEDAIVNFAITGKSSFSDLTKSILADMARIATRQASSALLTSLVGAGTSYLTGSSSPASAGSSSAGYSDAALSGWSGVQQAKGGAWSGGVQMFANGGAFTNSVVSKPTAFGMSGGQTGLMGEAGPEAIMPLTRTAGGKLGVMSVGGGVGGTQINVEVHIDGDGNATSSSDAPGYELFGKELATFVEQKYQQLRNVDMRQGGVISNAIKGR